MLKKLMALSVLVLPWMCLAQAQPCDGQLPMDLREATTRVLVLGEPHGTREFPELVKRMACELARDGKPVIVGLEISRSEQERLSTYLKSAGTPQDQLALTQSDFWNASWQDGRRSQAMFDLIDHLRRMRQAGGPVLVDAMDASDADLPQALSPQEAYFPGFRDAYMAQYIEMRLAQYPQARYVALTGSLHATKLKGAGLKWGASDASMALRLSTRLPVFTITGRWSGGMAWMCWERSSPAGCKPGTPPAESAEGFDLLLELGQLTPSPPHNRKP